MHTRKISIETLSVDWHHNDHQNSTKYDQSIFEKIVSFSSICFYLSLFVFIHYSVICSFFSSSGKNIYYWIFNIFSRSNRYFVDTCQLFFIRQMFFIHFFHLNDVKKKVSTLCGVLDDPFVLFLFIEWNLLVSVYTYFFHSFYFVLFIHRNTVKSDNVILRKYDTIILKVPHNDGASAIASITITIGLAVFILIGRYIF